VKFLKKKHSRIAKKMKEAEGCEEIGLIKFFLFKKRGTTSPLTALVFSE